MGGSGGNLGRPGELVQESRRWGGRWEGSIEGVYGVSGGGKVGELLGMSRALGRKWEVWGVRWGEAGILGGI